MISVCKMFEFEAAHHLPGYKGACRNIHGHSYKLEVEVEGIMDGVSGMLMDFSELKSIVKKNIIDRVDHSDLNVSLLLSKTQSPTAEVMLLVFVGWINRDLPKGIVLRRIRLWETSSSWAEWRRK